MPRSLIIPLNKHNFKNSKVIVFSLGEMVIKNGMESINYNKNYDFSVNGISLSVSNYNYLNILILLLVYMLIS